MSRSKAIVAICAAVALLSTLAPAARASLDFQSVDFSISSAPPPGAAPGAVGPPEVQAGSHPYQVKVAFAFTRTTNSIGEPIPAGSAKNLQIDLPPGLIGSLVEIPQCPPEVFQGTALFDQACPGATQVGTLALDASINLTLPVFNLEPPPGIAARLGVFAVVAPVAMGVSVRTGGDYGLTMALRNLPQFLPVFGGSLSLWGVPADARHDSLRGSCLAFTGESTGACPSTVPRKPFLTLPGSCGEPPRATLRLESWEQPGKFEVRTAEPRDTEGNALGFLGCNRLDFRPSMEIQAESRTAGAPSGLAVDLSVPQSENPDGLAAANVRQAVVALPAGISINPAAADGLGSCLPEEIGMDDAAAPRCPDSSRIGSAEIDSPLIAEPLQGSVYLAAPGQNEFGSTLAIYFAAERDGVLIKLAARIDADPESGQLTISLDELPQLPFSNLELRFDGGPRAPLAMPSACGAFTATARVVSHTAAAGDAPATPSSGLVVDQGCGARFSPSFLGGATGPLAGRHTGLALQLKRSDGEPTIRRFSATLPRGLLPLTGSIPLCGEAQATAGSCGAPSRIGSVAIAAGAGPHPFHFLGRVFLTGPYGGAPFGLSIAVPGLAGPFDLGTIVIRGRVSVDPLDARLTIATETLPRILQGIPLRIRSFDLTSTDRPGVFLAPTSCEKQGVAATAFGGDGASAPLASPFFLAGCAGLRFSPRVSAAAGALVTRASGVALRLVVRNPRGAQANLRAISVMFPRQLSPRLSTIQAACARAAFAAEPSSCPRASVVGTARVRTPILDVPLSGPAYLVSRGLDALPGIVLVLQGRGVVLKLAGSLRISDTGVTAVSFASIPDARISSFVLALTRGSHSALGASFLGGVKESLCARKLVMPTRVVAQSGSRIERSIPVAITGCAGPPSRSRERCDARCDASPAARRRAEASSR
ncbi:MAG: hypothetical protein WA687_08900 [Solirubrobacterales bacterium]